MNRETDEWMITAQLASLELDEKEALRLATEAEKMRELFLCMSEIDIDEIETSTVMDTGAKPLREDKHKSFPEVHELLDASPEMDDDFFLIPNVLQVN